MVSFKNVLISITAILLITNFAFAKKKAPKEAATSATPAASAVETAKVPAAEVNKPVAVVEPNSTIDMNAAVVTVDGTVITEAQVTKLLDARMEQLASRIPPNMKDQYRQQMRKRIVEQLTIEEILTQKEAKMNITVTQADVNAMEQEQMKKQNLSPDEFKSLLKAYGMTYSDFEQNIRKQLMFEKLMADEFKTKVKEPNDTDAKAFYTENIDQFKEQEGIHAKHILIKPEDSNDPNQAKAAAKAKAEDILKKIKGGANFEELAKEYSACPSSKNGGDLGQQPKGTFVPEFEKAAYALEPNQISDVVETSFGYHIIKLISHTDANTTSFEQVKEKITQYLTNKQKEGVVNDYIQKIKKEADLKFANPADNFEMETPKPTIPARPSSDKNEPNSTK